MKSVIKFPKVVAELRVRTIPSGILEVYAECSENLTVDDYDYEISDLIGGFLAYYERRQMNIPYEEFIDSVILSKSIYDKSMHKIREIKARRPSPVNLK